MVTQATRPTELTLADAAAAIRARALSPVELTEAYLRRIERWNPTLNAYLTVTAERALDDARTAAADLGAGRDRGPLHGIPLALTDLYATAGIRTTAGSKILADWVPDTDSAVARRLREAGSVLLGKLNLHEFAFGTTTANPHFGPTRNPWSEAHIPGGSSGGAGAAMAAGLAAATMGSDTGGSVRIPAALCGVVGLKPTYGRVSKAGMVPLSWTYDHPGPITRSVEDAALLLQAVAGYDPDDYSTVRVPADDYAAGLRHGVAGLRVGVPRAFFFDELDDEVRAAVERALGVLRGLGAAVRDVDLDAAERLMRARALAVTEIHEYHAPSVAARADDFGADLRARFACASSPTGHELVAVQRLVRGGIEAVRRTLEMVDVLVTPTTVAPAVPVGQERVRYGGVEEGSLDAYIRCTFPFNAAGLPALSLPCGFTATGLPIGLQIAGRPFDEATVLRVGHAYEQATEWHAHRPAGLA
jgi:aspartyl-tRNA(Asn)/glutamyl-tRNA(Gln) amidotransferase subunit A